MSVEPFKSYGTTQRVQPGDCRASVRSLPLSDWPTADQLAWATACRPSKRLKPGGGASHLKPVTRDDLARRYGYFLDHIRCMEGLDSNTEPASYVTPERVERYILELKSRVSSVTAYGSIYKLRRIAQLLRPSRDFVWLTEIEKDLALVMQPRSKFDRLVWTEVLVEAGITLMAEADTAVNLSSLARARQYRDGLMVALLALCPIRLKNFAALEIGRTFKHVKTSWWIVLSASETKEGRPDERPVPEFLNQWIGRYLDTHRPALARKNDVGSALWLSSNHGTALTYSAVERAIGQATLATIGVAVSPHMFRTAAASTSAIHGGRTPHLASAILHHEHPGVTYEHYNRATSLSAGQNYADIVRTFRKRD